MEPFKVLPREEVSIKNQGLYDNLRAGLGVVPNLYTVLAHSENALEAYINLENAPTSLSTKEVEVVNLVVSQSNDCIYCLSAHSVIAKNAGFSGDEIIGFRKGHSKTDVKLDNLARFTKSLTERNGHVPRSLLEAFFDAGYSKENLVDVIMLIGDRTISNILHAVTKVPVDFPLAAELTAD
ncbi:carboxymuconolactone decarboxylase family protein [Mucilaginibacter sp.]|jgi:AhpD family alkylhydroperoxidase|uniref:carboxymuconolactone decarboxylase family protein n=1 Tax=Mucilaginibacter sp. TaxID=1882438 RepID=UPI00356A345B